METISSIPSGCYQGYIWMSDQDKPEVIDGAFKGLSLAPSNPFIIEARLFETEKHMSYSVQFLGGVCHASVCNVEDLPQGDLLAYTPSFEKAPGKLLFLSVWAEECDPLCEGMPVLNPHEFVFVGFKK